MPHRCCVPNCNSGYTYKPGFEEKVKLFSTSDPKMQQKWTRIIPRKDYKVTRSSYVCVKHFADEDIVKGKKGRKKIICEIQRNPCGSRQK
jgi:hypothetical protein